MKRRHRIVAVTALLAPLAGAQALAVAPGTMYTPVADDAAAPCRTQENETIAVIPAEAPWVSLALANAEAIGLSEQQVGELESLRTDFQQISAQHVKSIRAAEDELQTLLNSDPVEPVRIREQLDAVAALRSDLRMRRIESLVSGRAVLSAEQQTALHELVSQASRWHHDSSMDSHHRRSPSTGEAM